MTDIKQVELAENSFLALWQSYTDKKMECEVLNDRVKELEAMLDTILLVLEGKTKFSPDEIDTQNARVILEGNK